MNVTIKNVDNVEFPFEFVYYRHNVEHKLVYVVSNVDLTIRNDNKAHIDLQWDALTPFDYINSEIQGLFNNNSMRSLYINNPYREITNTDEIREMVKLAHDDGSLSEDLIRETIAHTEIPLMRLQPMSDNKFKINGVIKEIKEL